MERPTAQQASDPRAGNIRGRTALAYFLVRHGIDSRPFAAVEREARVDLLGVGDLRDREGKPATPPTGHRLAIKARQDRADGLIRACREPEKADESNRD